jgi:archaemetzincin
LEKHHKAHTPIPIIQLQPLGKFATADLQYLKDSIEQFYPVQIQIGVAKPLPPHAYYAPRNRYRADSIIAWLKLQKPDSIRTMVGLTTVDVSTTKAKFKDYGVMGLGYQPGPSCVVSTFRLQSQTKSYKQIQQRLFKVVAHELGHNFGLPHCDNQHCIMVDAEGKMKLDAEKDLCHNCKVQIKYD